MDGWRVVGMAAALRTYSCFPPVVAVAQLLLGGNYIGDAGILAVVGALAANETLTRVCDEAEQQCGLHVHVRVSCPHWLCAAHA